MDRPAAAGQDLATSPPSGDEVEYCYGHPKTPTRLHCSRCGRPICGRCAIAASVGQHCPECVAEARRSAPKVRSTLRANAPVVYSLIAINVLAYAAQTFLGFENFTVRFMLIPQAVDAGQWYRLVTAMFLHGGALHIIMNMYVLFIFGPNVEQAFGSVRTLAMYLAAGLMGSAFSYAIPPESPSLGASGAIFGLAGILLVYLYKRRTSQFLGRYLRSIGFFIVANLVLGFALSSFIDIWAHIGGLVGGIILALGFDRRDQLAPITSTLATLAVVGGAVLLVMMKTAGAF
ncbi:MAG TPA: rhomboid family intramembrane serine protease [Actinomycetota bacterium]|nr:rhomboid family intramembrane serine protease [Actinomycetota bacterium]